MSMKDYTDKIKNRAKGAAYSVVNAPGRLKNKGSQAVGAFKMRAASTDPQIFVHDFLTRPVFSILEEGTKLKFDEMARAAEKKLADKFFNLEDAVQESITKRFANAQAKAFMHQYPNLVKAAQQDIALTHGKPWRGRVPTKYAAKKSRASVYAPLGKFEKSAEARKLRDPGRLLKSQRADRLSLDKARTQIASTLMAAALAADQKTKKGNP